MRKINQIIDGGYCIGCGACAFNEPDSIGIELDEFGCMQAEVAPQISDALEQSILSVCPFSDNGPNEDQIGLTLFGESGATHDERIGYYRSLFIGHVGEGLFREKATSGGIITWVLTELLATDRVDYVIHVKKADRTIDGCLFKYSISQTAVEVLAGAKSRYYPIEISQVMQQVRELPGRYVFVGIPCFVKAVRRLMLTEPILADRIKFCVGLVCGHLKSTAFADYFAWQAGIEPGALEEIDFRVKRTEGRAGDYAVYLKGSGKEVERPTREFLGSNWGHNFFRYSACDYCDDVFAETADIAVGDAWLPNYDQDPKGTSIVVIRNAFLSSVIETAENEGRLHLDSVPADLIASSQGGGLRDRRVGLAYRLYLKQKANVWAPKKRVPARELGITLQRRKIYKIRSEMGWASHIYWQEAVQEKSLELFDRKMGVLTKKNGRLYNSSVLRCGACAKKIIKTVLRVFVR